MERQNKVIAKHRKTETKMYNIERRKQKCITQKEMISMIQKENVSIIQKENVQQMYSNCKTQKDGNKIV